MRIEFKGIVTGKEPQVTMEYDVKPKITISTAKVLSKMNLRGSGMYDKEEIFVPLNLYLNSPEVPEKSRKLLYDINVAMVEIDKTTGRTTDQLMVSYIAAMEDLLAEPAFREKNIAKWAERNLAAPPTAEDKYDKSKEGRHSRYSTYLKGEYYELMALTIFIRIALFVIVVMIRSLGSIHDDKLRRMKALDYLPASMKDLPSYKRLLKYVKSFSDKVIIKTEDSLSLSFDDENKVDMLLSVVLFHVLITGKVVNIDENRHIVSLMFNKIAGDNALNAYGKSNINPKSVTDSNEEDNSSVFESYRTVFDKTIVEQVNLSYRGSEKYLLGQISHLLDETEYRLTMKDINKQSLYVNEIHLNLLYVIMKDLIPPEAFSFVSKTNVKHILVMASMLIREKHPYLSVMLLSNSRNDLQSDTSEYHMAPPTMTYSVPAELKVRIKERYPLEGILHPSITEHPVIKYVLGISKACSTDIWVVKPNRPWFKRSPHVEKGIVKTQSNVAELVWDLIEDSDNIITGLKTLD